LSQKNLDLRFAALLAVLLGTCAGASINIDDARGVGNVVGGELLKVEAAETAETEEEGELLLLLIPVLVLEVSEEVVAAVTVLDAEEEEDDDDDAEDNDDDNNGLGLAGAVAD
jgi:hypothetical protein